MNFKYDMHETDFLAVGADQPDNSRGDFDDLGTHRYCADCPDVLACHRAMCCGLELKNRGHL